MLVWIDLANSPHVPFFRALLKEFAGRGHEAEITARDFAQTVELALAAGMNPVVIGAHGGRRLSGKAGNLFGRARALAQWARGRGFALAVSHNSYAQLVAARWLGIPAVTLMDYEHQPANHVAFRLAARIIVPRAFPAAALRRYGAQPRKVFRYDGIKEDVYLADFAPDPRFPETLAALGVGAEDILVIARPPARDALYHRFDNELFDELLADLSARPRVRIILLARSAAQREACAARHRSERIIMPHAALDGSNLIAAADLVVSAGGTMNREAAALGTPAATVYAGRWAAVDEQLLREGKLQRIRSPEDIRALQTKKKASANARRAAQVRDEVVELILKPI